MIKISVIGSGNVACHLSKIISKTAGLELVQIVVRTRSSITDHDLATRICTNYDAIAFADLYIIAVSDHAVAAVSKLVPFKNRLVVHTSGTVALNDLDVKNRRGVFYPLQTFSKNKAVDFKAIPFCLEAEHSNDFIVLEKVASALSNKVFSISTEQRKAVHVAAVFVCNFVNYMYQIGNAVCDQHQIPFEILQPLIQETAKKIEILSPVDAQTGPAKREDSATINAHLRFLSNENQKDIYKMLTKSIIDHGKKL